MIMKRKKLYSSNNFAAFTPLSSAEGFEAATPFRKKPVPKPGRKFFKSNPLETNSGVKDGKVKPTKDSFSSSVRKSRLTSTPIKASIPQLTVSKEKLPALAVEIKTYKSKNASTKSNLKSNLVEAASPKSSASAPYSRPPKPPTVPVHSISTSTIEETPPSSPSPPPRVTSSRAATQALSAPTPLPIDASAVPSSSSESSAESSQASDAVATPTPTKRGPEEERFVRHAHQLCLCGPILRASEALIVEEIRKMVRAEFGELCRLRADAIANYIENKFEELKQMKY